MQTEILKAFRFALDPTSVQVAALSRHAGAARWAFNHALAAKVGAHERWRAEVAKLVGDGVPEEQARRQVRVPVPMKPAIQKALNAVKGDSRKGLDGACPWWHEVNTYAFQSAFIDADQAWKNWLDSLSGKRVGRRVGYPRFKKKGRARDSFRLHHDVKKPSIRLAGYRRLRLPRIGEVRLHDSGKRLARLIDRGDAVVQSVTVSRGGHRWYASVLCKVTVQVPDRPSRRQRERGAVGVDLGVKVLAALSKPLVVDDPSSALVRNPQHLRQAERRLLKAQRALARTQKGSARREKAKRRVGRAHHEVAVRRHAALHQITKRLTTGFAVVALEDLNVAGMTRSARGTVAAPGKNVRQKAGLNRVILDSAPAELRRQVNYKATWYGSELAVADRWFPSSKTCSGCGWQNPHLKLSDRVFRCTDCGLVMDRDMNAARNIERHAVLIDRNVACDRRETLNARGASIRPTTSRGGRHDASKREGSGARPESPQQSDLLTLPTLNNETATPP
ncbi:RNA-guided endonuclease InsQ/TnpB family protein [Actinomadura craniellae]|uniref:RNA-guided endonuclease InsQ/TnpB family protein n=1 Tax=Actinomadura craniellae TaxID=2231787 RepID=UPI0018F241EE|nr:RNA-guided endonuclease TnpB family protein [Actinomadura craniellae]